MSDYAQGFLAGFCPLFYLLIAARVYVVLQQLEKRSDRVTQPLFSVPRSLMWPLTFFIGGMLNFIFDECIIDYREDAP